MFVKLILTNKSAVVSFFSYVVSWLIFYEILHSPQAIVEIIVYSLGGSVGAYYIIKKGYGKSNGPK